MGRVHNKGGVQLWAYDRDFATHRAGDYIVTTSDGTTLEYKVHIVLEQPHFYDGPGAFPNDSTREIMAQFLNRNGFPYKTAPKALKDVYDIHDPTSAIGPQVGKCFTVYYSNLESFYKIVKGIRALIAKYGLNGIPKSYFESVGANLQYEYPVPDTNDILYYTLEKTNGVYLGPGGHPNGYAQRKEDMNKYFGEGPLDFLFPILNPQGVAFT